jgi:hypothetical protein
MCIKKRKKVGSSMDLQQRVQILTRNESNLMEAPLKPLTHLQQHVQRPERLVAEQAHINKTELKRRADAKRFGYNGVKQHSCQPLTCKCNLLRLILM